GVGVPVATLTGCQATKDATLALTPAARLVLLASHGDTPDGNPSLLEYALIFSSEHSEDARLTVRDVLSRSVVLSSSFHVFLPACPLGEGVLRGEEALGFAQAFLSAGAGVVLAPLWAIDDAATAELSIAYHRELLSPERPTVAEAWQQAMVEI